LGKTRTYSVQINIYCNILIHSLQWLICLDFNKIKIPNERNNCYYKYYEEKFIGESSNSPAYIIKIINVNVDVLKNSAKVRRYLNGFKNNR